MANTSARTLRLLSLLQTRRYWPGAELAERLEVSARTLRRDVDRLRELGYPVQAQRGVDGGYQLAAGAALPPLVVDDEEAVALAVGLQVAAQGAVEGIAEASVRALAKVIQVMPARLRRRVEALSAATVPASWASGARRRPGRRRPGVLTTVALACRDAERLRFSYTAAGGQQTERHVEPYRLVLLGRRWYLVGYDLTRQRLAQLPAGPAGRAARHRRPVPAARAARRRRRRLRPGRHRQRDRGLPGGGPGRRARRGPSASAIGRWATVEEISPATAPRSRVRMTADQLDWPMFLLGLLGAEFQVISPPELLDRIRDWARRFGQAAGVP